MDSFIALSLQAEWPWGVFSVASQRSGLKSSSQAHAMCCIDLFPCFTPCPSLMPMELLSLIKANAQAFTFQTASQRLPCFLKYHFPFHQQQNSSSSLSSLWNELEAQYPSIGVLSFPTPPFPWRILTFVKTYRHRTLSESHSTTYFNLDHAGPRLACGEGVIKSALEWFLPLPCHRGACHPHGGGADRQVELGHQGVGVKLMLEEKSCPTSPHTHKKIPPQTLSKENSTVSPWLWSPYFE